ncbi:MAG TPA: hypothetical protein VMH23_14670 [Bacteroidota bacterium]|nr:hypothetical protein [Bacteroidota bacterium]
MKNVITVFIAAALASQLLIAAPSDRGKLGIGIVLGAPTGFSLKYWENQRFAYQGTIGSMFSGGLTIGADALFHENIFRDSRVPFYYGPGVFIGNAAWGGPDYSHDGLALGVRAAFGADFISREYPFDAALELGPALLLAPKLGIGVQLSLSFRYYP